MRLSTIWLMKIIAKMLLDGDKNGVWRALLLLMKAKRAGGHVRSCTDRHLESGRDALVTTTLVDFVH
jgi:hypothetical protein